MHCLNMLFGHEKLKPFVWTIIQFKQCIETCPNIPKFFYTNHLQWYKTFVNLLSARFTYVASCWGFSTSGSLCKKGLCTIQWNHNNWKIGGGRRKAISRFHHFCMRPIPRDFDKQKWNEKLRSRSPQFRV